MVFSVSSATGASTAITAFSSYQQSLQNEFEEKEKSSAAQSHSSTATAAAGTEVESTALTAANTQVAEQPKLPFDHLTKKEFRDRFLKYLDALEICNKISSLKHKLSTIFENFDFSVISLNNRCWPQHLRTAEFVKSLIWKVEIYPRVATQGYKHAIGMWRIGLFAFKGYRHIRQVQRETLPIFKTIDSLKNTLLHMYWDKKSFAAECDNWDKYEGGGPEHYDESHHEIIIANLLEEPLDSFPFAKHATENKPTRRIPGFSVTFDNREANISIVYSPYLFLSDTTRVGYFRGINDVENPRNALHDFVRAHTEYRPLFVKAPSLNFFRGLNTEMNFRLEDERERLIHIQLAFGKKWQRDLLQLFREYLALDTERMKVFVRENSSRPIYPEQELTPSNLGCPELRFDLPPDTK